MLTRTAIADYLSPNQPMQLKDELKATANLLLLFLSNGVFKLFSLAIIITCMRKIAIVPFVSTSQCSSKKSKLLSQQT